MSWPVVIIRKDHGNERKILVFFVDHVGQVFSVPVYSEHTQSQVLPGVFVVIDIDIARECSEPVVLREIDQAVRYVIRGGAVLISFIQVLEIKGRRGR